MRSFLLLLSLSASTPFCFAQIPALPEGSHVDLYFPHLADGGAQAYKFQTSITLLNPNSTATANVELSLLADNGSPLALDFGQGALSLITLSIPPGGTRVLNSTAASQTLLTGWAEAVSSLPLQGTVQFRSVINGTPQQGVSALATLPSQSYVSPSTALSGVALANPNNNPISLVVAALDTNGNQIAIGTVNLGSYAHTSFNLNGLFPGLPVSFSGSVIIKPTVADTYFVGWTLSVDSSGVLSSYPPGRQVWPLRHLDEIRDAYYRDLDASQRLSTNLGLGVAFNDQAVPLNILYDKVLNAYATKANNSVSIELALSELISDSPSELAWAVGHEMGHIIQFNTPGKLPFFSADIENDADAWGMFISLNAGYDPYAAAGTLAKLAMATNDAGLVAQNFDNMSGDLHGSFNNRIQLVYSTLQLVCNNRAAQPICSAYKSVVHPDFPSSTPLAKTPTLVTPQ
jgi:hypothetical protein